MDRTVWVELNHGRVQLHRYVAPDLPTVMEFVAILVDAFSGSTTEYIEKSKKNR